MIYLNCLYLCIICQVSMMVGAIELNASSERFLSNQILSLLTDDEKEEVTGHHPSSMLCMNIKPQHTVDVKQITGTWYGNEIIMHTQDVPGIYHYNTCVLVSLYDVTDQMVSDYRHRQRLIQASTSSFLGTRADIPEQTVSSGSGAGTSIRYIRLIWSEGDDNIEYNFNYTASRPGLWSNMGEQRGSMVALNQYVQFEGRVQVVKAVYDHLVLTFCSDDLHHSIYTIILSRTIDGLSGDTIRSLRNLLSRRGLYTESIRKVCLPSSGAVSNPVSWSLMIFYCSCLHTWLKLML